MDTRQASLQLFCTLVFELVADDEASSVKLEEFKTDMLMCEQCPHGEVRHTYPRGKSAHP